MRTDTLPPEFSEIAHLVGYVQKKSANEFSGSCPQCGGAVHKDGSLPDRFVMFRVGRYGFPLGFCRNCGFRWTAKTGKTPSQEDVDEWRKNQIEVEKARKQAAERALEFLQADHAWNRFFLQNNSYSLGIFESWGVSKVWIDYLQLGLIPDYVLKSGDEQYHSPAFTIPIWNVGGVVQNIKLRLANPRESRDRYRNFYSMGQSFLFVPLYDLPLEGVGVLVEGEKKSIVMEQKLDNPKYRVVGLQSKTPSEEVVSQLKKFEAIYLWLDPDANNIEYDKSGRIMETANERMVRILGKERVRIVDCPIKSDDGILQGMNPMNYIRMAKKA